MLNKKSSGIPLGIENNDPFLVTSFLFFLLPCLSIDSFLREIVKISQRNEPKERQVSNDNYSLEGD
jgi:hypothetical protein